MWSSESGKDPGGPSGAPQELADLRDQFEQQQVLISQLKEMLRKTEQTKVRILDGGCDGGKCIVAFTANERTRAFKNFLSISIP